MTLSRKLFCLVATMAGVVLLFLFVPAIYRKPAKTFPEPVVVIRRLADGSNCKITIQSDTLVDGRAQRLSNIELMVGVDQIAIPPECFKDLADFDLPGGAQVADFAGEIYLLLTGGPDTDKWQAKFTIRDRRVVERLLSRGNKPAQTIRYPPPSQATILSSGVSVSPATNGTFNFQFSEPQPLSKERTAP